METVASLSASPRNRALQLYIYCYLAPLTVVFLGLSFGLAPVGSLIGFLVYGPPLAALWNTVLSWKSAPVGAPPFKPGSFELRRAMPFLCLGLVLFFWPVYWLLVGDESIFRLAFGSTLLSLPAAVLALCAMWHQLRAGLSRAFNGPAA